MNHQAAPPTRSRVVGRGLVAVITLGLGGFALERALSPLGWLYLAAFLLHWLVVYPRLICPSCAHYGRVCPSWGGKISALFYDRPRADIDPARFAKAQKWGHLAGIALRALPIAASAAVISRQGWNGAVPWWTFGGLLLLGLVEGCLYLGRICRGCHMSAHCPVRWDLAPWAAPSTEKGLRS